MRIYSKTGDKGTTSLLGGKRVSKSHLRIEAYGTVDELVSYTGLLRDQIESGKIYDELVQVQDKLMVCASLLAADCDNCETDLPKLDEEDVSHLEKLIDEMDNELPPLRSFILPGGHSTVSFCHITRNVCRRAERYIIRMHEEEGVPELVISYVNRLSDFFFVLGRKLSKDLSIKEVIWNPKK